MVRKQAVVDQFVAAGRLLVADHDVVMENAVGIVGDLAVLVDRAVHLDGGVIVGRRQFARQRSLLAPALVDRQPVGAVHAVLGSFVKPVTGDRISPQRVTGLSGRTGSSHCAMEAGFSLLWQQLMFSQITSKWEMLLICRGLYRQ